MAADEVPIDLSGNNAAPAEPAGPDDVRAQLWFVDEDGILRARRYAATDSTVEAALRLLLVGPNTSDASLLSTAIPADTELHDVEVTPDGLAIINLGPIDGGVFAIDGDEQLRAFAQLVFTATGVEGIETVRFEVDQQPVEAPTDEGPSEQPVDRSDFGTLDPATPTEEDEG